MHNRGVPDDFLIARNPDPESSLPYLLRVPVGQAGIVLKARDTWPRTTKIYCHRAEQWPSEPEIVQRVPVRHCRRRGAAIDLVLDRGRENRSQFVLTRIRGGREAIFWQSARTTKQARPNVSLPTGRAQGLAELVILVDDRERYPYTFRRQQGRQQVRTERQRLDAGDYAVRLGERDMIAVERKSLTDLSSSLLDGSLRYALSELASLPRAAVVVEDRFSKLLTQTRVRPAVVADALAEAQIRFAEVPLFFAETRALAEEWTYRFLAAGLAELEVERAGAAVDLPPAGPAPPREASTAQVRAWALRAGLSVSDRGRLRPEVWEAYRTAHPAPS